MASAIVDAMNAYIAKRQARREEEEASAPDPEPSSGGGSKGDVVVEK